MFDRLSYGRKYYNKNRQKLIAYKKKWRSSISAKKKAKEYRKRYRESNKIKIRAYSLSYQNKIKKEVMDVYGGKCRCCNEDKLEFLTLDHTNNDGRKQRKELGIYGIAFYYWVRKQNFPSYLQVLCYNCNCAKGHKGYCPHEKEIKGVI
jgi:hypothetical protein